MQGKPAQFCFTVGEIVYQTMIDTINVPPKDNFQIITEHDENSLIYDREHLDIQRTDGIVIIQITLNEGRTIELKKAFYKRLAERLHDELGIRMEDILSVSLNSKRRTGHSEMGLPSMPNDPFGLKSYKSLDRLTKGPIISTIVL
jgi:hypothetical protein